MQLGGSLVKVGSLQVYEEALVGQVKTLLTQLPRQQSPPSQPHSALFNDSSQNPSPQNDDGAHVEFDLHILANSVVGAADGADDGRVDGALDGRVDGMRLLPVVALGEIDGAREGIRRDGATDGLVDGAFSEALGSKQDGNGPTHVRPFACPHVDWQQSPSS